MQNSTDRELLELAAKAYGITRKWENGRGIVILDENGAYCWDPLIDDGDAFRLAAKLGIIITPGIFPKYLFNDDIFTANVEAIRNYLPALYADWTINDGNQMEVIRRLIVQAAAEIGKNLNDRS
jgi:hypothetical protein